MTFEGELPDVRAAQRLGGPGRRRAAGSPAAGRLRRSRRQRVRREQLLGARRRPGGAARRPRLGGGRSPTGAGSRHPTPVTRSRCSTRTTPRAPSSRWATRSTSAARTSRSSAPSPRPSADAETAANVYIPLDLAQALSGETGRSQRHRVQADVLRPDRRGAGRPRGGAARRDRVDAGRPRVASVSGSLATASSLVSNLGLWLSLAVLVAAFLIAILFTIAGRHPAHPRVRHAEGDRLVEPPHRRPGRRRVARAGPHRRRGRARGRPRRNLGREPHRAHARRQRRRRPRAGRS